MPSPAKASVPVPESSSVRLYVALLRLACITISLEVVMGTLLSYLIITHFCLTVLYCLSVSLPAHIFCSRAVASLHSLHIYLT